MTAQSPSLLFDLHVAVLILGMLSFLFASLSALAYLIAQRQLKNRKFNSWFRTLPPLETMDRWAVRAIFVGFISLSLGILTGIYLAHLVWPPEWTHDPKVICALMTWVWQVLIMVGRYVKGWRGGKFFALILVGFLFLVFTFVGVFFIFPAEPHRLTDVERMLRQLWISLS